MKIFNPQQNSNQTFLMSVTKKGILRNVVRTDDFWCAVAAAEVVPFSNSPIFVTILKYCLDCSTYTHTQESIEINSQD
jgi:hypothetical protein